MTPKKGQGDKAQGKTRFNLGMTEKLYEDMVETMAIIGIDNTTEFINQAVREKNDREREKQILLYGDNAKKNVPMKKRGTVNGS